MTGGEFFNQAGDSSKLISGEGVRDDKGDFWKNSRNL